MKPQATAGADNWSEASVRQAKKNMRERDAIERQIGRQGNEGHTDSSPAPLSTARRRLYCHILGAVAVTFYACYVSYEYVAVARLGTHCSCLPAPPRPSQPREACWPSARTALIQGLAAWLGIDKNNCSWSRRAAHYPTCVGLQRDNALR